MMTLIYIVWLILDILLVALNFYAGNRILALALAAVLVMAVVAWRRGDV